MARTFQILKPIPRLAGLSGDDSEDVTSLWDWLGTDTGKDLISNLTNIASQKSGVTPIYRSPTTGSYYQPAAAVSPLLILGGLALVAVLMARK